jgi:hypothetical protein
MKLKNVLIFCGFVLLGVALACTAVRMQQGRVELDDDWDEDD